jgi:hypothetical protein
VHLLMMSSTAEPAHALAQLELARQEDPSWKGWLFWRAILELRHGARLRERVDSEAMLRSSLTQTPDDERALRALVFAASMRLGGSDLGLDGGPRSGLEAFEGDVSSLARVATGAASFNTVAWYYALRRAPAEGLPFAEKAVAADPGCASCWDTLAALHFQGGDAARALATQQRAMAVYGEEQVPGAVRRRLARYVQAMQPTQPAQP